MEELFLEVVHKATNKTLTQWYSFHIVVSGSYEVIIESNDNICAAIYNSERKEIINNALNEGSQHIYLATTLTRANTYYIKVSGNDMTQYSIYIHHVQKPTVPRKQWALLNRLLDEDGPYIEEGIVIRPELDINIVPVWQYTKGNKIRVGIADTRINEKHRQLVSQVNTQLGYDFVHDRPFVIENLEEAQTAIHGTHIAGIINRVAPEAELIPLVVIGEKSKYCKVYTKASDSFIKAIEYAKRYNIKIINCSFCGESFQERERRAMLEAREILFIIAAGNDGRDLAKYKKYPACYDLPNSIVVTAVDLEGKLYKSANYGGPTTISAPGVEIWSTGINNDYIKRSGTSVATAFVTGACALLWALEPTLTVQEIKKRIIQNTTTVKLQDLNGKILSQGMLNVYRAIMHN